MHTKSLPAGQREYYRPGDLFDFYRPPISEDASAWIGIATVLDTTHIRGHVTSKHIHLPFECRLQDMRRHIPLLVLHAAFHSAMSGTQVTCNIIKQHIERLSPGEILTLGLIPSRGGYNADYVQAYRTTLTTIRADSVLWKTQFVTRTSLGLTVWLCKRSCPGTQRVSLLLYHTRVIRYK